MKSELFLSPRLIILKYILILGGIFSLTGLISFFFMLIKVQNSNPGVTGTMWINACLMTALFLGALLAWRHLDVNPGLAIELYIWAGVIAVGVMVLNYYNVYEEKTPPSILAFMHVGIFCLGLAKGFRASLRMTVAVVVLLVYVTVLSGRIDITLPTIFAAIAMNIPPWVLDRIKKALRLSEERFRLVFMNAVDIQLVVERDSMNVLEMNNAGQAMFGKPKELIIKKHLGTLLPDGPQYLNAQGTSVESIFPPSITTMEAKKEDGSIFFADVTASNIPWSYGQAILLVLRDVTVRVREEEEKEKTQEHLIQAQKMESIGLLAGGVAHDFNNILVPIIGYAELLLDEIPKDDIRRAQVMEIFKSAQRASSLVKHILAFSRQSSPLKISMNPATILKEVLGLVRASIPSNIAIERDISADCGYIFADPTQIHQIVMNLITNAYHAIGKKVVGTIKVNLFNADIFEGGVEAVSLAPGRYVCMRVSDTGSGIDPLVLPRIFEPYYTTKPKGKGTGLGLSIIHGIVHEYGGDVVVNSQLGEGSAFSVYLPMIEKDIASVEENGKEYIRGSERVMLVDDEEVIVKMGIDTLKRLGYSATGYTASLKALDVFKADPLNFDLVITDMAMPNMTGLQMAKKFLAIRPDIPILMYTGFSDQIDRQEVLANGLKGLLKKPLLTSELATELRKALDEA